VCLGLFLLGMDLTVLNVAIPDLQRDLAPSMAQVQWIVDGYALMLGGTVLAAGAVTDRIGRRRSFTIGLAVCGAFSILGALAQQPWPVIVARFGMGAGAALLMPATLSIISNLFPESHLRRRAIALWAVVGALGGTTGPVVGGWLVHHFSWHAGFWINVPVTAVAIVLALLVVPESRAPHAQRVDVLGVVLSATGLLTLVWAIIESPARGWTSAPVLAAFTASAVLLTAFISWQARSRAPMLPLSLIRRPQVGMNAAALALMSFALFDALFVITLYLQEVLGYTPWQAGLRTLPMPAAVIVGAAVGLPFQARYGVKTSVVVGLGVVTAAFAVLATTHPSSGYDHLVLFQLIAGFGAGMVGSAGTEAVMAAVPPSRAGLGSAINDATRQVGVALGVAVQGSIITAVSDSRLHTLLTQPGTSDTLRQAADHSILSASSFAEQLPDPFRTQLLGAAREAFIDAMTTAALVAGSVTLLAAAAVCYWLPTTAPTPPLDS